MSITSYYNVCEIHPPKTLALCEEMKTWKEDITIDDVKSKANFMP